jgi:A118 family predicted phage portal protein
MPLPAESIIWPPEEWRDVYLAYAEWSAWYSGSTADLAAFYGGTITTTTRQPWWRFWSRTSRTTVEHQTRSQLHVPLAGDMASVNAALLFGEQPRFAVAEAHEQNAPADAKRAEERLAEILREGNIDGRLTEAADACAALGGVLLKVDWDKALAPLPLLTIVQPDMALPEFRYGRLVACTLWRLVDCDGVTYLRHLERHEPGRIEHGLYRGTADNLGARVPLEQSAETATLQDVVTLPDKAMMAVRYIPNTRPNRRFRGSALGQSDYSGAEGLMDALDETWTSWMRDIRLGKSRILVPEEFLSRSAQGRFEFDVDAEVFTPLDIAPGTDQGITENQFELRVTEHEQTSKALVAAIVGNAGYAPQTFGLDIEGQAESGTALRVRERKTLQTQQRKRRYWESPLADLGLVLLAIDRMVFERSTPVFRPRVQMADSLTPDEQETATTIELLNRAGAVSTEIKVTMMHPDWEQEQVDAEVQRIRAEQGLAVEDPIQIGVA